MRPAFGLILAAAIPALAAAASSAATPHVSLVGGDVAYTAADGQTRSLTTGGGFSEPVLSPDGKTAAFIHTDGPPAPAGGAGDDPPTSLWVAATGGGPARKLIGSHNSDDMKQLFMSFSGPLFSLDGGYIYVTADAWATSGAVHQVSLATGQEHFVIDGGVDKLIRTGPWRGDLLVTRHMYYPAPRDGSYDPTYVVQPDARKSFMIPGTDKDDNVDHVAAWLKANRWEAW